MRQKNISETKMSAGKKQQKEAAAMTSKQI
jgi:hypothetical protein